MCSLVHPCQEDLEAKVATPSTTTSDLTTCKRCKSMRSDVVLRGRDAYCAACFLSDSRHKFRAGLGKRKVFRRPGEKVLAAFGGGASSLAMLGLLEEGESEAKREGGARRRILFEASVLVIDEMGPFAKDTTER